MLNLILIVMAFHWFGDFCLQTNAQASNKWHSNLALFQHTCVYTLCMTAFGAFFGVPGIIWGLGNGVAHFMVDYVTSKITHRLYTAGNNHEFFVVVGADQYIHMVILVLTFVLIVR